MWHVYIIRCADNSLYTGVTTNIARRITEHNAGKGGAYTSAHKPVKLIYQESRYSKSRALKREAQIKRWTREKKLTFINSTKSTNYSTC